MENIDILRKSFKYDPDSPSGIIYTTKIKNHSKNVGDVAGRIFVDSNGTERWKVNFNGIKYSVPRLILLIEGYTLSPDNFVDHIDGNPLNNKIENLRIVSLLENNRNKSKSKNNKSGQTGVFLETITNKTGKVYSYFVSFYYQDSNVEIRKRFSINKLGEDAAWQAAVEFRKNGILNSNFYTERHGK